MVGTHKGRPQRAFGIIREEHVSDEVHYYIEVKPQPLTHSRTPIPTVAFSPPMKNPSTKEMPEIMGKGPYCKTSWYSPGAGDLPTEHADHDLMRDLDDKG